MSDSPNSGYAWEIKRKNPTQCEDCAHTGWRPYIRYQDGTYGWLCKSHYHRWIHSGHLWPLTDAENDDA